MQTENLFSHSRALDRSPTFRNILFQSAESAFDDLLDPDDADSNQLALRHANRMRASVSPFAVLDPSTHHHLAIQSVFQRAVFYPSRYSDGSYPVWYGCTETITTVYETAYHMIRESVEFKDHPKPIRRQRLVYKVSCNAILIDLTQDKRYYSRLTDTDSYRFTQQIGRRVRTEMHPGLLAPSARHKDGTNVVIFTPSVLSNPILSQHLTYQLDLTSMQVTVFDENDQQEIATIDGKK
jgi:hypothetical protein